MSIFKAIAPSSYALCKKNSVILSRLFCLLTSNCTDTKLRFRGAFISLCVARRRDVYLGCVLRDV